MIKDKKLRAAEIKRAKTELLANCKDASWAKKQISKLLSLQKQDDLSPSELNVPTDEVIEEASNDTVRVVKTTRGYLFQTRSGALSTFVESKYGGVCSHLQSFMDLLKRGHDSKLEDYEQMYLDSFSYVYQAPIFAAMGANLPAYGKPIEFDSLFNIALAILKEFNRFTEKHFTDAEAVNETESDIAENNAMEAVSKALENLPEV